MKDVFSKKMINNEEKFAYFESEISKYLDNHYRVIFDFPRNSGKTTLIVKYALQKASKFRDSKIGIISKKYSDVKCKIHSLTELKDSYIIKSIKKEINTIEFKNGSIISFFNNDMDNLRGLYLNEFYFDELAYYETEDIYKYLSALEKTYPTIGIISTNKKDTLYNIIVNKESNKVIYNCLSCDIKRFFDDFKIVQVLEEK